MNRHSMIGLMLAAALLTAAAHAQDQSPIGELMLHPKVEQRATPPTRNYVRLSDPRLMYLAAGGQVMISDDDGQIWTQGTKIPTPRGTAFAPRGDGGTITIRARSGAIIVVYLDWTSKNWRGPDKTLHAWSVRSLDDGQTWADQQMIFDGYCGAIMDIIQTKDGHIVVPVQAWLPDRGRHGQYAYVSSDDGQTWTRSNLVDAEETGSGGHAGTFEAALTQLSDGRLWMLLRSTEKLGRLYQAFSRDNGLTWEEVGPTDIDSSSSPAAVLRLQSGRLAMVWNRLHPATTTDLISAPSNEVTAEARRNVKGPKPQVPHREDLWLAFSEDDGRSWTEPVVIAKQKGNWLAYCRIFEVKPGELWIDAAQGGLVITLHEKDFVDDGSSFSYPQR